MKTLDELLQEYSEKFDDNFPIRALTGMDEAEIIKIVEKSLNDGKPYKAKYIRSNDY